MINPLNERSGTGSTFLKSNILISAKKIESEDKQKKFNEKIKNLMENFYKILNYDMFHEVSFGGIYKLCYDITIEKGGSLLYSAYKETLQQYLNVRFTETSEYLKIDEASFLSKMTEDFSVFIKKIEIIQKTMLYFERSYLDKNSLPDVKVSSKKIYESIFLKAEIKTIVSNFILNNIQQDRENEFIDKFLVKDLVSLISDIDKDAYKSIMEANLITSTINYYADDYMKNIQNKNCQEYSLYVRNRIREEEQRIIDLNLNKSARIMMESLSENLVSKFISDESRIIPYIISLIKLNDSFNLVVLKEICLFSLCDKFIDIFARSVEVFGNEIIKEKCTAEKERNIISSKEEHLNLIANLLDLLDKVDQFKKDLDIPHNKTYLNVIANKISNCINTREFPLLIAKILPKHIDHSFKSSLKSKSKEDLKSYIEKVFNITRFIIDKDVFEMNHRRLLSFRLLNNLFNEDIETKFIGKLKLENGAVFTHRCEVMINDMKTSSHMMEQYRASKFYHKKNLSFVNNVEFSINVLTQGNWIVNSSENILTKDILSYNSSSNFSLVNILSSFDQFFRSFYHNKIIYHNLFLGNCEVFCSIKNRNYSISMTPFQAMFCLMFHKNSKKVVTLEEVILFFKIGDVKSVVNCIIPLIKSKLLKVSDEEGLTEISINPLQNNNCPTSFSNIKLEADLNFFHKQQRLRISSLRYQSEKITNLEQKQSESVHLERKYIIESNIIRIMKSRNTIHHNDLVNEVLSSVDAIFIPEINAIKVRIESLLERGYITRCKDDFNAYKYSA